MADAASPTEADHYRQITVDENLSYDSLVQDHPNLKNALGGNLLEAIRKTDQLE